MGPRAPLQARPIDMGLPSGLLWASCNVGAEKPSDPGLYFSWGNVEGHDLGEGYDFSQAVYDSTPAADIATDLSLEQDAARVNLGTPWRMPTDAELKELYDNCTVVWTTMDGVNGRLFTSNLNGKKVFFPAAGYYSGTRLDGNKLNGYYWSSTYISDTNAQVMAFNNSSVSPQLSNERRYGFSVRAVVSPL